MKETYNSLLEVGGAVVKILDEHPDSELFFQVHVKPQEGGTKKFTLSVFGIVR